MNSYDKYLEVEDKRLKAIAQNGNDGLHYESEDRKSMPVYSGVLKYFPDALKEVSKCSLAGNNQHHPNKPLHWDKNKSTDNEDALVRHLIDHSINPVDEDGVLHLSKVAWRALAALQIYLDKKD
jgi:hypothetical protein